MIIKTKKRGEIEVGGDKEMSGAISKVFGPILDEAYDITIEETTITMFPDEELTICVAFGGNNAGDHDFKTVTLEELVRDSIYDNQAKAHMKEILRKIADTL